MKINIKYITGLAAIAGVLAVSGCKKDFFNRPPRSRYYRR